MRFFHRVLATSAVAIWAAAVPAMTSFGAGNSADSNGGDGNSIIFVDSSIRNRQALTFAHAATDEVVILNPDQPLLEQIAAHLNGKRNINSIHVVTHGEEGTVLTHNHRLDSSSLSGAGLAAIDVIRSALAPDADILLYGCRIAASVEGKHFVRLISDLTQADVAASINDTGHASLAADWTLEYRTGPVETEIAVSSESQIAWHDRLAINIVVAANTSTLINALTPNGTPGVTFTGTPTIFGSFASNAYGTFSLSNSSLGMPRGAVFGTGNVLQISGTPGTFWDGPGTGVTATPEFDRAALTFSFIPQPGVSKVMFRYILGSEEYNEYVGQNFSDNLTIRLTGGAYSNTNVATVPGTSTGIDIDTINLNLNSSFYRDNTTATPPVSDSVLDGHTTVLRSITPVVPGTTYTAEIKVADFGDTQYNSALFIDYFGSSLQLDLDSDNSSGATAANYQGSFTEGGPAVPIADADTLVTNFDTTLIQSATITLTNAKAADSLSVGTLPPGISASTNTSTPGVIVVTLSGSASAANYQSAIAAIRYSNTSNVPDTSARNLTVVVNDGSTNSNTASSVINVVSVPTYLYTVQKTVSAASVSTPGLLTYTITLANTGDGAMTSMSVSDVLAQGVNTTPLTLSGPAGDGGVAGQFDIGETWVYTASLPVTQARLNNGNALVNTVTVSSAQTAPAQQTAQVSTTIVTSPSLSIVKTANTAGPVGAGDVIGYSYVVTNTGNVTIENVQVNDQHHGTGPLPPPGAEILVTDVSPMGDSTDSSSNGAWDALAPGDSVRFTAAYLVTQADVDAGP